MLRGAGGCRRLASGRVPRRIVLWGATGYTGRLVTAALVELGVSPLLAGRDASRLGALASEHRGLDYALADLARPESIGELLGEGDVLVSTVGPFTLFGRPALRAAIRAGAHYLDSTGEPAFMRHVFGESSLEAARRGIVLLPAFGYDFVPGNVVAAVAARSAGPRLASIDVGYLLPRPLEPPVNGARRKARPAGPMISTGTRASLLALSADPHHLWAGGRLVLEPSARRLKAFGVSGQVRWASSIGGSEPLGLPSRYPGLESLGVYMEFPGPAWLTRNVVLGLSQGTNAIGRFAPGRRVLEGLTKKLARRTGGGPSAETRQRSGTLVVATCRGQRGELLSAARLEGPVNGYTLTGKLLAWGAAQLQAGTARTSVAGALGPVDAFGLDECCEALCTMGVSVRGVEPEEAAVAGG